MSVQDKITASKGWVITREQLDELFHPGERVRLRGVPVDAGSRRDFLTAIDCGIYREEYREDRHVSRHAS